MNEFNWWLTPLISGILIRFLQPPIGIGGNINPYRHTGKTGPRDGLRFKGWDSTLIMFSSGEKYYRVSMCPVI